MIIILNYGTLHSNHLKNIIYIHLNIQEKYFILIKIIETMNLLVL